MSKLVSVIIPIYNAGSALNCCLNTVLKQTHENLQILLIDDGSTDNSLEICKMIAETDYRVSVFHHDNHGVSYTRNVGLRNAIGDFIIFIDADDIVDSDYIRFLVTELEKTSADILICGIKIISSNHTEEILTLPSGLYKEKDFWELFCKTQSPLFGYIPNKIYRRELIQKNNIFFNENMNAQEDLNFALKVFAHATTFTVSPHWGYTYFHIPGKRKMPIEDLISNKLLLYKFSKRNSVALRFLTMVSDNIRTTLHGFLCRRPPFHQMKRIRNIDGLNEVLLMQPMKISESNIIAFFFRLQYFKFIFVYMQLRSILVSIKKHIIR